MEQLDYEEDCEYEFDDFEKEIEKLYNTFKENLTHIKNSIEEINDQFKEIYPDGVLNFKIIM